MATCLMALCMYGLFVLYDTDVVAADPDLWRRSLKFEDGQLLREAETSLLFTVGTLGTR